LTAKAKVQNSTSNIQRKFKIQIPREATGAVGRDFSLKDQA
jgi:hypothetical protein